LALTFAVVAPAFAGDDAKTIAQQLDDKWIEGYSKNDAAALTALYTADAVLLPHSSEDGDPDGQNEHSLPAHARTRRGGGGELASR
jgi:ketosteroid isomerase-like protein